jgi:hypothetical protein
LTKAYNTNSIAIGGNALVSGTATSGIAIGKSATVTLNGTVDQSGIAIGPSASTTGRYGVTIGKGTTTSGANSVAIGVTSVSSGTNSVAIGNTAKVTANYGVAVGLSAHAYAVNSVSIGRGSQATVQHSVAVGYTASATDQQTIAIGWQAKAYGGYQAIAIGSGSTGCAAKNSNTIAIGGGAFSGNAISTSSIAIGFNAKAYGTNSICIGGAQTGVPGNQSQARHNRSVVLGFQVVSNRTGSHNMNLLQQQGISDVFATFDLTNKELTRQSSSMKYKTNVRNLENIDVLFDRMIPVRFSPIDHPTIERIGFIAEDMANVFPEVVAYGPDGIESVNYPYITAINTKQLQTERQKIQDLTVIVSHQANTIAALQQTLSDQGNTISDILSRFS